MSLIPYKVMCKNIILLSQNLTMSFCLYLECEQFYYFHPAGSHKETERHLKQHTLKAAPRTVNKDMQ